MCGKYSKHEKSPFFRRTDTTGCLLQFERKVQFLFGDSTDVTFVSRHTLRKCFLFKNKFKYKIGVPSRFYSSNDHFHEMKFSYTVGRIQTSLNSWRRGLKLTSMVRLYTKKYLKNLINIHELNIEYVIRFDSVH